MKKATVPIALCATILLAGLGTSVQAQTQQAKATHAGVPYRMQSSRTEIILGGEVIMRLIGEAGRTAEQRADIIRERLIRILAMENLQAADVVLRAGPDMAFTSIYVRDHLLCTITQGLARVNNTTPESLAHIYAERFRRILPMVNGRDYNQYADVAGHGSL